MHNQAETKTNQSNVNPDINYELSTIDRLVISIDQPMGAGTFFLKNLIQGVFAAFTTAAVFKGLEYFKERKERREQELSLVQGGAGNYKVAGE